MTLSPLPLDSGGLGVGLERSSGVLGGWATRHGGSRGSWEGIGGLVALPLGLTGGGLLGDGDPSFLQTFVGLQLPDLGPSLVSLSSTPRSLCSMF